VTAPNVLLEVGMSNKLLVMILGLAACSDSASTPPDANSLHRDAAACDPNSAATVYVNFDGATYSHGLDDARANTAGPIDTMRVLAPWPHANAADIVACVQEGLAPFNINVTTTDPGSQLHHEIVMTTSYWGPNGDHTRSISTQVCGNVTNSVAFVFGDKTGPNTKSACHDALSQFALNAVGLDHAIDCHDWMHNDIDEPCGPHSWTTTPSECGDTEPRACECGGMFQISMNKMRAKFGSSCEP
jgi:hypothetical protein